ncbi:hypothetical protein POM88_008615 [Heracleum sosnowskyi]|uniref:Late embryogenesis abundant protein LEA-2 subgroup domain-containing protein n=1 Tax=Heracleum sosnowskyi TaxID=360622 RepID=A0AAD8J6R4_9APIA|nr:hypothetical protein POM88_008615 [Heracleum sosnowskyi]
MSLASKYKYNTFQHPPEDRYEAELIPGTCSDFVQGFTVVCVVVLTVIGAIWVFFPALLYPKDESFSLPQIKINSFSVTGFNLSSNQVSGNWDFEFVAANYNHNDDMAFPFQSINVSLLLKNQEAPAYVTVLQPFDLGPKSFKTHIIGSFSGSSQFLDESSTKVIANEITTNGVVEFDVKLESSVKNQHFGAGLLKAYCGSMEFFISLDTGTGKMLGGTVDCDVGFI